jgi:hypothetical protein
MAKEIMNWLYVLLLLLGVSGIMAQGTDTTPSGKPLPFAINPAKCLKGKDLEQKKEGWFPTGIAGPFSDANAGTGVGGRIFMFNNGKKEDPFFECTPYRQRFYFNPSITNKGAQYHEFNIDVPYIFDTAWRVRLSAVYDRNPVNLFFGIGTDSMKGLSYRDRNDPGQPLISNGNFDDLQKNQAYRRDANPSELSYVPNANTNYWAGQANALTHQAVDPRLYANGNASVLNKVTDRMYNRYELIAPSINPSAERSFFAGLVRLVAGARLSKNTVKTYDGRVFDAKDPFWGNTNASFANISIPTENGRTKVTEDAQAGKIRGLNGGYVNSVRLGLVYDSRNYEPDPSSGMFAEVTHERAMKGIGSNYEFNRTYISTRLYYNILPAVMEKVSFSGRGRLVFAGRVSGQSSKGDLPFFEYRNMWSTEGNLSGLGGRTTLRGFIQDRFVGPVMAFSNLELRWRFAELANGAFAFQFVPFFDFGRVWDRLSDVSLQGYKYSYSKGGGIRIIWNQSTVIYFEFARSSERASNFYFNFGHIF